MVGKPKSINRKVSRVKLTSSNFAAAMGLNPYLSRQKLWKELTGREPRPDLSDNVDVQRGVENEFRAVAAAEAITGLLFQATGANQKHYTMHEYGATPDGHCGSIGLEVKAPRTIADTVPIHYLPQVQGQCWIAGFDTVVFCQWTEMDGSRAWMVPRSDEYIAVTEELLAEFRLCLVNDEPPKRRKKPVMPEVSITRIN